MFVFVPRGVEAPDLVVVKIDGGRLQIRERTAKPDGASAAPDEPSSQTQEAFDEAAAPKGFWREDKIGLLLEMKSQVSEVDPCPEIPAHFVDALRIPVLAKEIGKVAAQQQGEVEAEQAAAEPPQQEQAAAEPPQQEQATYEPPEVERRNVVATCRPWWSFALLVAQAAWAAGFQKAKRKGFVADGSANNWRVQKRFFSSFTPILDFIHALSYVYAAALAGRVFEEGWECYQKWIAWVWKGEVSKVIEELGKRQEEVGTPQEGESETSVASVVARALGYLSNHQDKMKYDEYRKAGLPLTSSLMESMVKQMNQRVKGTEKFWCGQGAEAIVQLRADYLSDDEPLETFFQQRQHDATGQRPYRHTVAA